MIHWSTLRRVATAVGASVLTLGLLPGSASAGNQGGRFNAASAKVRAAEAPSGPFTVVANNLNNPRKLSIGPDGSVYVAEAGKGGNGNCASDPEGGGNVCAGLTGSITRIAGGTQTRVITGLPSVAPSDGSGATGPADVAMIDGQLRILIQDTNIDNQGANPFGAEGELLGHFVSAPPNTSRPSWTVGADFAKYEAQHNPDNGSPGSGEPAIDSDPYGLTPTATGYAVADAAGNDVLALDKSGTNISLVGVLPTQTVSDGQGGTFQGQPVPTEAIVGPDGALYVGELALSSGPGKARIWRISPGQQPTLYASGFSNISDMAFDAQGRLLVLEFSQGSLESQGPPAPGALIRIEPDSSRTILANDGLIAATGVAVAPSGDIYISNFGVLPESNQGPSGQVVKLPMSAVPGYRMAASDGGLFAFGVDGFFGSLGGTPLNKPIVGIDPVGPGYRMVASDGGVFTFGTSQFFGSMGGQPLNKPIIGLASTPDDLGYWMASSDGGVFAFGDAQFAGSLGGTPLNKPIVGIAAGPTGGYWMVASDGGVFTFGGTGFFGSTGAMKLNKPIVGMAPTPSGKGYWLVASDGGVFTFGDAAFFGSTGAMTLNKPITTIVPASDGKGYRLVATDGGVFVFGSASFNGSLGSTKLNAPIVGGTS